METYEGENYREKEKWKKEKYGLLEKKRQFKGRAVKNQHPEILAEVLFLNLHYYTC